MAKKKTEKESPFVPVEEQPYPVPENWCWVTVDVINHYSGGTVNPMAMPEETFELYSVPSSANDYPEIVTGAEIGSTKQAVMEGDVLLCKINPRINRVWLVSKYTENELLASSEWIVVRNEQLDSRYLMYCFKTQFFREYMLSNVSGVGGSLMRAQPKFVKRYPIPVAPFLEQQRIVGRIESLFAKLDEAKEKAQEALDSFEIRKNAILHEAYSGKLTNSWEVGNSCSNEWRMVPLKDICELRSGATIPATEELQTGAIPYIKVADMNLPENQTFITTSSRFVDHCDKSHEIPYGSTIFPKRGGAIFTNKKRFVAVDKIIMDLNIMAIMPNNDIVDNKYIFYWMQSVDLKSLNNGSSVPQINNKDMVKLFVPISGKEEQKEVVRLLDEFFAKEAEAKAKVEATLDTIEAIKKSILAKAFRGELGTNNPEDESAEELLKRTLA